jgi:hypothetical protein
MELYRKPIAVGRAADTYCVECDSPMTRDEAALNYKLVDKKTTHLLCPTCLSKKMELPVETLRGMIELFRKQGCTLFTPWVEK